MKYRLLFLSLLCGAVLLALSACSDPGGVGANLGVDSLDGGTPQSLQLAPTFLDTTAAPPQTGSNSSFTNRSWRFLAGTVKDPVAGVVRTEGYVDFRGIASRDSSIKEAEASELDAELRLQPTYLHGDTTSTLEVHLFALDAEAEMHRATADTSFTPTTLLSPPSDGMTYSVTPTDSLVSLPLPESWIRNHLDPLQADTTFEDNINGFKIAAATDPSSADRQIVAGFDQNSAGLRLTTETDTVDFNAFKSFTHVERNAPPEVSLSDWTVLQDGVGINLSMNWDFETPPLDTLKNTPLNRADVTVPIATMKLKDVTAAATSDQFVRPSADNYRVLATRAPDTPPCPQIGVRQLPNEEDTCILSTASRSSSGTVRLSSETAFRLFERALVDTPLFTSFRIEIAVQEGNTRQGANRRGLPSTLPALVRTANGNTRDRPHATLIVTPL